MSSFFKIPVLAAAPDKLHITFSSILLFNNTRIFMAVFILSSYIFWIVFIYLHLHRSFIASFFVGLLCVIFNTLLPTLLIYPSNFYFYVNLPVLAAAPDKFPPSPILHTISIIFLGDLYLFPIWRQYLPSYILCAY